jgi:hypothetical protein
MTARLQNPVDTGRGSLIPPLNMQPAISNYDELAKVQEASRKTVGEWSQDVGPAVQAQQRFETMAGVLKSAQSGAWATDQAAWNARLQALGLPTIGTNNPADVQIAAHANILATANFLKSVNPRFTQRELFTTSEQMPGPDLLPQTNAALISEAMAVLRRAQTVPQDWVTATQLGWRDAQSFSNAWNQLNPMSQSVAWERANMGPLKGESGNTGPAGAPGAPQKSYTRTGRAEILPES